MKELTVGFRNWRSWLENLCMGRVCSTGKKKKLKEWGCKEWCEESKGTIYKGEGI